MDLQYWWWDNSCRSLCMCPIILVCTIRSNEYRVETWLCSTFMWINKAIWFSFHYVPMAAYLWVCRRLQTLWSIWIPFFVVYRWETNNMIHPVRSMASCFWNSRPSSLTLSWDRPCSSWLCQLFWNQDHTSCHQCRILKQQHPYQSSPSQCILLATWTNSIERMKFWTSKLNKIYIQSCVISKGASRCIWLCFAVT